MPTIIDIPQTGEPFGEGFMFAAHTTTVGPFTFPQWKVELFESGGEVARLRANIGISDPHTSFPVRFANVITLGFESWDQYPKLATGQTGTMRVALMSSGSEVEHTTQDVTMNNTDGAMSTTLQKLSLMSQTINSIQSGFTTPITTGIPALQTAVSAMQVDVTSLLSGVFTSLPGFAGQFINNIVGNPPVGIVKRELIGDFTLCGGLTRPAFGTNVDAFGIAWEVISYGGGIGVDVDVPQRFETRLLDLELRHRDHDAHEFTSNVAQFDYSNGYWFFSPILPQQVNYCIAPSVTMRLYWLLVQL
jgi:hypothetical protein